MTFNEGPLQGLCKICMMRVLDHIEVGEGQMRREDDGQLRLVWLEAFIAAAALESYSLAARRLGTSQPSVTRYIGNLEKWLGKILILHAHPVRLTDDGKAFVPIAEGAIKTLTGWRAIPPRTPTEAPVKRSAKDIRLKR